MRTRHSRTVSPKANSVRIFEPARGYHQWLAHLSEFSGPENPFAEDRPAIVTDISDFYQRIYSHRIENVLLDAGVPHGAVRSGQEDNKGNAR